MKTQNTLLPRVSLRRNTAVYNMQNHDNYSGTAYVFVRSGTVWTQEAQLDEPAFGYSEAGYEIQAGLWLMQSALKCREF